MLDKLIRDTIKRFAQIAAVVGAVTEGSGQLRQFLESGKKIIITTVHKSYILDEIGNEHRGRKFAILIDEAHSPRPELIGLNMLQILYGSMFVRVKLNIENNK